VDPVGSGYGSVVGSCEYGDEPSGSGITELGIGSIFVCIVIYCNWSVTASMMYASICYS
jgi:hypothetical protein